MKPAGGMALGGRYRLVSRVAVGGMGEVWVAHDDALRRDVAVKVLREEFAGDEGFLERFRTEARNSAQLSHPNIAALYDYGEQEGSGFLVMELVLGEPMSDLLDRQPVLPTRRLLPILAQTARALHAAHVAGVVHRDVKPGNILLARSGRVKITDFGISTASNQVPMTASGMVMGTAQYLSPEQAVGKAATPMSDIYSLGIVAYEGLVGHRPFTGPTAVDIAIAHVNTPVPPLPAKIDPALASLVMRMLAKDPEERPRSAASLARHLDEMLDATPSDGVPLPYGRHARPVDVVHAEEESSARRTPPGASTSTLPRTPGSGTPGGADQAAWSPPTGGLPVHPSGPLPLGAPLDGAVTVPADGAALHDPRPGPPVIPPRPAVDVRSRAELRSRPAAATSSGDLPRRVRDRAAVTDVPARLAAALAGGRDRLRSADVPGHLARGGEVARRTARGVAGRVAATVGSGRDRVPRLVLAVVLMVVFALLGAAFADRLWGPSRAADSEHGQDAGEWHVAAAASPGDSLPGGMIHARPEPMGTTTTARDL